jgi:hypothetical protein
MMRHCDGRVHFSDLKCMAKSPLHYRYACANPRTPSSEMLVGAAADRLVFGYGRAVMYEGRRAGMDWVAFQLEHPAAVILIESEWARAAGAAKAVVNDSAAARYLQAPDRAVQRCLSWEQYGLPFQAGIPGVRGGVDLLALDTVVDLKVTHTTEPGALMRHAWASLWPQQLTCYVDGCRAIGLRAARAALICVESTPPHPVTVLSFDEADFDEGRKSLTMWTDRLRQCEEADEWPGYVSSEIPYEPPSWVRADGE